LDHILNGGELDHYKLSCWYFWSYNENKWWPKWHTRYH